MLGRDFLLRAIQSTRDDSGLASMQDDPQSIDRLARTGTPESDPATPAAGDVQVATLEAGPGAPDFDQAVAAAGLKGRSTRHQPHALDAGAGVAGTSVG